MNTLPPAARTPWAGIFVGPEGRRVALLALGTLASPALASPLVCVSATVSDDHRTIQGEIAVVGVDRFVLTDPIAALPRPTHDLDIERTFPAAPEDGSVRWRPADPNAPRLDCGDGTLAPMWQFETTIPRRLGDTGFTQQGLQANGGWYPTPMTDGHLLVADHVVTVRAAASATVVLGGAIGHGEARWRGEADRASLAVIPDAWVTPLLVEGWDASLVTRGRARPGMLRRLHQQLPLLADPEHSFAGAIVEAPLRRRLVVPGAGVAWISDRSWRVFPWFRRLHDVGAVRGLTASLSGAADSFDRGLIGAGLSLDHADLLRRKAQVDLVGLTKWIPVVDNAIYDPEMPYQDELFRRAHPGERVRDELRERMDPTGPPAAAMAQLADARGADVAIGVARAMLRGATPAEALAAHAVQPNRFDPWRAPYPAQDYTIALADGQVTVRRDAPPDALPEVVVVRTQAETAVVEAPAGPSELAVPLTTPATQVSLDPKAHLGQLSRLGEQRPPRLRWTLNGQISGINISQRFVDAYAVLTARRSDDTWNRFRVWAFTDQRQRIAGRLSYTRFFGRLTRQSTRAHQLSFAFDAAWLNPNFRRDEAPASGVDLPQARYTIGGSMAWFWDSRLTSLFPMRGSRFQLAVGAGGAPETRESFVTLSGAATTILPFSPRHVAATRLAVGAAITDIPQSRNRFGGTGGVRGIPDNAVQTELQAVASLEYRAAPIRGASIPLGVLYIEEIDLTLAVDGGVGVADGGRVAGLGATAGVNLITENLGLAPGSVNVSVGLPLLWSGFELERRSPQLYIGWGFGF